MATDFSWCDGNFIEFIDRFCSASDCVQIKIIFIFKVTAIEF